MTPKGSRPVLEAGWWAVLPTQLPNSSTCSRSRSRYARSFERTLEEFYQRIQPFALPFMAGAGA
jgi:hypothetical protein